MKMVSVECHECKRNFEKRLKDYNYSIKSNPNYKFYCNMKCYNKNRQLNKKEKIKILKNCLNCNLKFEILSEGSGGHNRGYCYKCYPENMTKKERAEFRRDLIRNKAIKQKESMGCSICGYNKTHTALEWHHKNDDKNYNPSDLIKRSWELYQKEISKCVLLCSNCHREVHAGVSSIDKLENL